MEVLQTRTTSEVANPLLNRQSGQLVGYLEVLSRRMALQKRPGGVSSTADMDCSREEFRALTVLGATGPIIMSSFAEALGLPLSTATRTVDRLVEKKLVVRTRSDRDRRLVQVEISESARQMQEVFRVQLRTMARSWLVPLSRGEREIFLELMDKITHVASPENGHPHR